MSSRLYTCMTTFWMFCSSGRAACLCSQILIVLFLSINVNGFLNSVAFLLTNEDAYAKKLHLHVSLNASDFFNRDVASMREPRQTYIFQRTSNNTLLYTYIHNNTQYKSIWCMKKSIDCESAQLCVKMRLFKWLSPQCVCQPWVHLHKQKDIWLREKERESTKTLSTTPLELHIYCIWLVLARMQVCLILPYFLPLLFQVASTTLFQIHRGLIIPRPGWHVMCSLIFYRWLELQQQESVAEMISYTATHAVNLKNTLYSTLPVTTSNTWYSSTATLTARLRLLWQARQTTEHKTEDGRRICTMLPLEFWICEGNNLTSS